MACAAICSVTVTLTGKRSVIEREITGAEEVRDEESVDW